MFPSFPQIIVVKLIGKDFAPIYYYNNITTALMHLIIMTANYICKCVNQQYESDILLPRATAWSARRDVPRRYTS